MAEKERAFDTGEKDSSDFVIKYLVDPEEKLKKKNHYSGYFYWSKQLQAFEEEMKINGKPIIKPDREDFALLFEDNFYRSERVGYANLSTKYPKYLKRDINMSFKKYGIEENSVDAVVTDPPYGYGEDLNKNQIAQIYKSLFNKAFRWLKSEGHLVFCCLDKVKTGRTEDLLFTEEIIQMANQIAKSMGIDFIKGHIHPISFDFLNSLNYWKSRYALNRSIVALKILKKE